MVACVRHAARMALLDLGTGMDHEFHKLIDGLLSGDEEAAWELVEKYEPHIRRAVRHILAPRVRSFLDSTDFAQAVWASLLRDPARLKQFSTPKRLVAYLAGIARMKVLEAHRRWLDRPTHGEKETVSLEQISEERSSSRTGDTPSAAAIAREKWTRLMSSQPPEYQELLRLRLQGYRQVEIAERLGIHERTIRKVLQRLAEFD